MNSPAAVISPVGNLNKPDKLTPESSATTTEEHAITKPLAVGLKSATIFIYLSSGKIVMVPQSVLEVLRSRKMTGQPLPNWAMLVAAKRLGLVPSDAETSALDTVWNRVIDELDKNYPGWRGVKIEYLDGSVG